MLNAQRAADRGPIRSQICFRTSHDDGEPLDAMRASFGTSNRQGITVDWCVNENVSWPYVPLKVLAIGSRTRLNRLMHVLRRSAGSLSSVASARHLPSQRLAASSSRRAAASRAVACSDRLPTPTELPAAVNSVMRALNWPATLRRGRCHRHREQPQVAKRLASCCAENMLRRTPCLDHHGLP